MFKNEPLSNLADPAVSDAYQASLIALAAISASEDLYARPIVDGRELQCEIVIDSYNPSTGLSLGKVHLAGLREAEEAIRVTLGGKSAWDKTPAKNRAAVLVKIASIIRDRKSALSALITLEVGKSWVEADADVAEAIDFCEYYALEMERLAKPRKTEDVPGENNYCFYQPRGLALIISPWNFPLAIACGMTVAALVAGNTVILKPARQSSLIAYELSRIIIEAGVPVSAFAYLPSPGSDVGAYLASHSGIDMICFTGSKDVGLDLIRKGGLVAPGQRNVKKIVAEMGGKNAIIVDDDADVEKAAAGIIASAFGYSGQKCSACSRLIVVGDIYESLISRLASAAAGIRIGDTADSETFLGPVIDESSQKRILAIISDSEKSIPVLFKGTAPSTGFFVPPVIFTDVPENAYIWKEEIFGPVLAVRRAATFIEALDMANDSAYALTGGVFSSNHNHLDLAAREFRVGNLYLNRKITGALVCRQPFGGFRMSGVGSKAGGPDYLLQFLEPRTVSEQL